MLFSLIQKTQHIKKNKGYFFSQNLKFVYEFSIMKIYLTNITVFNEQTLDIHYPAILYKIY